MITVLAALLSLPFALAQYTEYQSLPDEHWYKRCDHALNKMTRSQMLYHLGSPTILFAFLSGLSIEDSYDQIVRNLAIVIVLSIWFYAAHGKQLMIFEKWYENSLLISTALLIITLICIFYPQNAWFFRIYGFTDFQYPFFGVMLCLSTVSLTRRNKLNLGRRLQYVSADGIKTKQLLNKFKDMDIPQEYNITLISVGIIGLISLVQLLIADIAAIKAKHKPGFPIDADYGSFLFRATRAHANTNESIFIFISFAVFGIFSHAHPGWLNAFALAYIAGRVSHMICYYANIHLVRSIAFGVSLIGLTGMLISSIIPWL